jgi:hypothetical protein
VDVVEIVFVQAMVLIVFVLCSETHLRMPCLAVQPERLK